MITRHILKIPAREGAAARKVHYRRCGDGPMLLMVHQSPRNSVEYEDLMRAWGTHFTCIAPDSPGFGQSDPLPGDPEIEDFADAVAEFVEALGVKRCAAYGFHSGGIILVTALKRHPEIFSCLAVGGYAVWTGEERRIFGESYLPPFRPSAYGEHLAWLWNRMLEQSWFFPWFAVQPGARLSIAHADLDRVHQAVMEMLDAGDAYRAGYGAVLRARRDIPADTERGPPVLVTAYDGDPLQPHLERLGALPANWTARAVATPAAQDAANLAFLRRHCEPGDCGTLPEDAEEGWIAIGEGLVHWQGTPGARRLTLHEPAGEGDRSQGALVIDVPGHGLSSRFSDMRGAIVQAAAALGAGGIDWPAPPAGEPSRLYPDLSPGRFGEHLLRAWGAARAELFFRPWYEADAAHAIDFAPDATDPERIATRARARLRAGSAAAEYHALLERIAGSPAPGAA